jgi:uncharacterized hydrophobic protein (TIGR00271 family)
VVHLRIVAPPNCSGPALDLLKAADSVQNVILLPGAAQKPEGDVILCDVAREEASVILSDLRELDIPLRGSIALEAVDTSISSVADKAERAAAGLPSDAVVWEEVESRTSEQTELSVSFVVFMSVATLIASVALLLDQPVLIVGAMIVGPEFGPIAGVCVAAVELRGDLARKSVAALAVGFPVGVVMAFLGTLLFRAVGIAPDDFGITARPLTGFASDPDAFSFVVAYLAGTAGVLSLTTAKSGAIIGVLVSVTTIPAAANVGVAAAYSDWSEFAGALSQLLLNLGAIFLAGIVTLYVQRVVYISRRKKHLGGAARQAAGLPARRIKRRRAPG